MPTALANPLYTKTSKNFYGGEMLGSRQTRPSDPSAWPVFGLLVLSAGMVPNPRPMPCLLMHVPTPRVSSQGDPTPSPNAQAPSAGGDNLSAVHRLGASPSVHKVHTPNEPIVCSDTYSVLKRGAFTQALDTLAVLILSSSHPIHRRASTRSL